MKKVLFLVPHLSTGGMPQYTYDLMRKIINDVDVYCVEHNFISPTFVVQRNRIIDLLGDRFFCLDEDKLELLNIIKTVNPDVIHLQEVPEYFLSHEVASQLYDKDRNYVIVETSHDSSFPANSKRFFPDHFALISQYQKNEFSKLKIPIDFVESDIEYKERQDRTQGLQNLGLDPNLKHVVNVGLFTPRKNQAEAIEYARKLQDYPIQFHFIGNQADNFRDYWEPLLENLPPNVKIWGERTDVDNFYSCMDMMLFTSRGTGNDKETSPLVIREAIGYNLQSLIFNLPVYLGMYDKYESIKYLNTDDFDFNQRLILDVLGVEKSNSDDFSFSLDLNENKVFVSSKRDFNEELTVIIRDKLTGHAMYRFKSQFTAGVLYWIQPAQKWYLEKNQYIDFFKGYLIDIYDSKNNLIANGETPVEPKSINTNIPSIIHNKFNTSWMSFREIFFEGIYDHFQFRDVKTAVDIGANDGLFTDYLLKRGVGKVISVEPDTRSTEFLNKKYSDESRVHVLPCAMTPTDCELQIYGAGDCTTLSSMTPGPSLTNVMDVRGISFDTMVKETGIGDIDLIKIDIEGAEYDLIDSIPIEVFDEIKYLIIELHPSTKINMMKVKEKLQNFDIEIRDHGNDNIILSFDSLQDGSHVTLFGINKSLVVRKNVKAVHLLLKEEIDSERQIESIRNVSQIGEMGIRYIQHMNSKYIDLPPVSRSRRPHDVTMEKSPSALNPTHYGCYESMKNAILSEFDSDDDFLILFEGDAKIYNHRDFIRNLNSVLPLMESNKIGYLSMGGKFNVQDGSIFSSKIENLNESFFICDRIICCHCIIFPKWFREKLKTLIREEPWDAADLYFNDVFNRHNIKMAVSNDVYVTQFDGISMIEGVYKKFSK